jgi:hypothetical protein
MVELEADLGPNGNTTSTMHCSRREWTGDKPDNGHKTERDGMLFVKPLHLTLEEDRLSEVTNQSAGHSAYRPVMTFIRSISRPLNIRGTVYSKQPYIIDCLL